MAKTKKYHKPEVRSEKAFDARTGGFTIECYCNSRNGGDQTSCSSSHGDPSGM